MKTVRNTSKRWKANNAKQREYVFER